MGSSPDRVAFVLSGGASLGAVQVGMLRALYERGIVPELVVGTSVGAINGAFVSSRPQTVSTVDELAAVWHGVRRGLAHRPSVIDKIRPRPGDMSRARCSGVLPSGAERVVKRARCEQPYVYMPSSVACIARAAARGLIRRRTAAATRALH